MTKEKANRNEVVGMFLTYCRKTLVNARTDVLRERRRMHGSRSRSTFPFQMFPSIRLRIYERFVGGMVEGRIPLPR